MPFPALCGNELKNLYNNTGLDDLVGPKIASNLDIVKYLAMEKCLWKKTYTTLGPLYI
jgi:hypothetical protein